MHPQVHQLQPYHLGLLQPWVDAAKERGIRNIAFTDHDRYCAGVNFHVLDDLRERNPDMTILAGIELDNDPITGANGRAWVEDHWDQLDFVLGSVHYLSDPAMFDSTGQARQFEGRTIDAVYEDYFQRVRGMIQSGLIDCLAHLDLIKIHGHRSSRSAQEWVGETLDLIKEKDLAIELSTAGWRKTVGEQYPSIEVIQLAQKRGIPFTIASDAHSPSQVGENFNRLAEILQKLQIKEVCIYKNHQREYASLSL